jgi:hypothetical protein
VSRARLAALLAAALVALAAVAALAAAETVRQGTLQVAFAGSLSPKSLPRAGAAPISVSVGGHVSTTNGASPPQLRRITIEINRNGKLDYRGLPTCTLDQIQPSSNKGALASCRRSLVGEGSFSAEVKLPQQAPFPSEGKVLAFNGSDHGHPVIFAHVYGTEPVPTSYTLTMEIKPTPGTFGTKLTISLPEVTSDVGFVTGIEMTLKRSFTYRGKRHSYLSAACPAPKGFPGAVFPLARISFAFAGVKPVGTTLNRDCKATG